MTPFWKQALEAAGWTALEMFLVIVGPAVAVMKTFDWSAIQPLLITAAMAAVGAAFSVIKSMIVRHRGGTESTLISMSQAEITCEGLDA